MKEKKKEKKGSTIFQKMFKEVRINHKRKIFEILKENLIWRYRKILEIKISWKRGLRVCPLLKVAPAAPLKK